MKKIARYARCSLVAFVLCAATFAASVFFRPPNWELYAAAVMAATLITALLLGKAYKKLKAAQLIVENQILHIQPAVLREQDSGKETGFYPCETVEVFVSCFGILRGSKIIKFNQEGIRLKAVEIGRDYLSLDYGTDTDIRNIRLLHARFDSGGLADIIEKIRYETGIVPVITQ